MSQELTKVKNREYIDLNNTKSILNYFQLVQRKFMLVDNFGLSLDDAGEIQKSKNVYLRDLFVTPNISTTHLTPEQIINAEADNEGNWHNIVDIISNNQRCFILGDPGMGKSTLIQWLMLALTYSGDNSTKLSLGPLVPFAFTLRELSINGIRNFRDLWDAFAKQNYELIDFFRDSSQAVDVIESLLTNGQAIILLDGLDEISHDETRKQLGKAILDGIRIYPNCKFVISSRVVGFNQTQLFGADVDNKLLFAASTENSQLSKLDTIKLKFETSKFLIEESIPEFYIVPFSYPQAKKFVSNWYSKYHPISDGEHEARVKELLERIQRNDGLGHLSRIPVLLNMICFIHARRGKLPDGRAELYQRISETYLVALDTARGIELRGKDQQSIDYADRCNLLSEIAFYMQVSRNSEDESSAVLISESKVRKILTERLEELDLGIENIQDEVSFLLRQFAERSGLFLPRGRDADNEERYGFTHLSFLEYFAARAIKLKLDLSEIKWSDLQAKAKDSLWQETFILFFEQLEHVKLTEKYLNELFELDLSDMTTNNKELVELLSAIVLDSGIKVSLTKRQGIISLLWRVVAQKANETDFIFLVDRLWTESYRSLELGCSSLRSLKHLHLINDDCVGLQYVKGLKQLESLLMTSYDSDSLQALSELKNLKALMLFNTRLTDITAVSKLKQLSILSIYKCKLNDISPIGKLKNLYYLAIENSGYEIDMAPLQKLEILNSLTLNHVEPKSLKGLSAFKKLTRLGIKESNLSDLSFLENLTNIEYLDISGNNISDLSLLVTMPNLVSIKADNNQIEDISILKKLPKLKKLSVKNNPIAKKLDFEKSFEISY